MKRKLLALVMICSLISCNQRAKYKYKIKGFVDFKNERREAIWYTDTISFKGDTAYYVNSNGTIMNILPPYVIEDAEK